MDVSHSTTFVPLATYEIRLGSYGTLLKLGLSRYPDVCVDGWTHQLSARRDQGIE